jgi:hypothetical protein
LPDKNLDQSYPEDCSVVLQVFIPRESSAVKFQKICGSDLQRQIVFRLFYLSFFKEKLTGLFSENKEEQTYKAN